MFTRRLYKNGNSWRNNGDMAQYRKKYREELTANNKWDICCVKRRPSGIPIQWCLLSSMILSAFQTSYKLRKSLGAWHKRKIITIANNIKDWRFSSVAWGTRLDRRNCPKEKEMNEIQAKPRKIQAKHAECKQSQAH